MRSNARRKVAGIDHREPAGVVGKLPQTALRLHQFPLHGLSAEAETGVVGKRADFNGLVGQARQPARIDAVDADVAARGGRQDLTRGIIDERDPGIFEIADVVVDPLADEQNRLPAAAHRRKPVRDIPERIERLARVRLAFGLHGIGQRRGRFTPETLCPEVLVALRHGRRVELAAHRPIDGREKQPPVARELLARIRGPCRVHDGHQIVGAKVLLNELPRRRSHPRRTGRSTCGDRRRP